MKKSFFLGVVSLNRSGVVSVTNCIGGGQFDRPMHANTVLTPAHVLGKAVSAAGPLNKKSVNFSGQKTNDPASQPNTGAGACTGTLAFIANNEL